MNIASNSPIIERQSPLAKEDEQIIFGKRVVFTSSSFFCFVLHGSLTLARKVTN